MASVYEVWSKLVSQALYTRLPASKFSAFATRLAQSQPLPHSQLADLLLRPNSDSRYSLDSLVPLYLATILQKGQLLGAADVLGSLLKYSSLRPSTDNTISGEVKEEKENGSDELRWENSCVEDEAVLYGIAKEVSNGGLPTGRGEALGILQALTAWVKTLAAGEEIMQLGQGHDRVQEAVAVRVAVGAALVAAVENEKVLGVLRKGCPKVLLKDFSRALSSFSPTLLQASPMIAERLDLFRTQTLLPLEPVEKKSQAASDEIDQMIDSALSMESIQVVDLPIINSRAGLYIYLNSLLVGRPLVDDNAIFNYLHNRYQGDLQSTCIHLITASFDVLANSISRNENTQSSLVLRSFLINKIPLLLTALSTSTFPPLNVEICIAEALSHVDIHTFPTFSSMFEETSNESDLFSGSVRQDFCFACCLHNLIPEENISRLLGETPMQSLPEAGRYVKEELVQQCFSDPEQVEILLGELERMDGNVGAASQAITEMIRHYCISKDTTSLKSVCSQLARKTSTMDIMLLFDKPTTLLQPICELLDGWRHDEDLGEYQPVYEEFGSILLLVQAFIHRYNLSIVDLGIFSTDSFIAKLLVRGGTSRPMDELTELEKGYLDVWIRGLFNAEGGGLGDEPMSSCPPQDFYLLMPTLMQQIVIACSSGHLSNEDLKGGLEFLVDTFLLPSLVGAITWLSSHLWSSRNDSSHVVSILQVLISPSSISSEASSMLSSILNIIATPLEHSLRWLQRSEPTRHDVEPLSRILKPHLLFSRTTGTNHTELESWAATPGGGIAASMRLALSSLVDWSLAASTEPTSYPHRHLLAALRLLGAPRLLSALVAEVASHTATVHGPIALDIAVAFICAPNASSSDTSSQLLSMLDSTTSMHGNNLPQPQQRRLTLRDALTTAAEQAPKTYKTDVLIAETVVRLFRRVEAQLSVPDVVDVHLAQDTQAMIAGAQAMADVAAMPLDIDIMGDGMLDASMDLSLDVGDEDLYGDLDM